jgi:hypothetical protein
MTASDLLDQRPFATGKIDLHRNERYDRPPDTAASLLETSEQPS